MTQLSMFPKNECSPVTWKAALTELRNLGYSIRVEDQNIKLIYRGRNELQAEKVAFLIETLKSHKGGILNDSHFLIGETIERIDEVWEPAILDWMKMSRPEEWEKIIILEREIDQYALAQDVDDLRKSLAAYRMLMINIARDFRKMLTNSTKAFVKG